MDCDQLNWTQVKAASTLDLHNLLIQVIGDQSIYQVVCTVASE